MVFTHKLMDLEFPFVRTFFSISLNRGDYRHGHNATDVQRFLDINSDAATCLNAHQIKYTDSAVFWMYRRILNAASVPMKMKMISKQSKTLGPKFFSIYIKWSQRAAQLCYHLDFLQPHFSQDSTD